MAMRLAGESSPADALIDIPTTKGDLFIRGASDIEKLAIGTKRFFPRVNEAGDGLEYVKGYEFGKVMRPWQWELAFFDWTTTVTGTGYISKGYASIYVGTGANAGSTARGRGVPLGWPIFGSWEVDWYVHCRRHASSGNTKAWIKMDEDTAADPTDKAIGWRIDNDAIKGIVHDGVSLDVVDLGCTEAWLDLFLRFLPGNKIEWYIDGVLKGSSVNIPTDQVLHDIYPVLAVANNADANDSLFEVRRHAWIANSI